MPVFSESLGLIAAFLTTVAFIPQVLLVWRTNDTSGVSLGMYCLTVIGIALWLAYGIVINNMPLIIADACTLTMSSYILGRKIRHTRRLRLPAPAGSDMIAGQNMAGAEPV